jgi:4-diphosphocytidyl-2-C-methyl-D-erythritol kinase
MTLNTLFNLGLDKPSLESYASQLGSDCAFFIRNTPMLATGRGGYFSNH